jgi:phosphatidylglycerol:prolipoprotein diacylglycerol transferase
MLRELHVALPAGWHATIGMHPLLTLVAVLAGARLAARRAPGAAMASVAVAAALVVLAGSRALYWLIDGGGLFASGGLTSLGGVVAGVAAAPVLARLAGVQLAVLLDALVPAALLALGIGRIGCLLAGCCYGLPTALPWGVVFPEVGPPARHPLQLYSAAVDLVIVWGVCRYPLPPGMAAARALAAFGTARFALETLRDPATTDLIEPIGLTLAQVLSLAVVLGARPWLRGSIGGLSGPGLRGSVARAMRTGTPLVLVCLLGASLPAAAVDAVYQATLTIRPARGLLDVASGYGDLDVKRWRLMQGVPSDGVDPAHEEIAVSVASDVFVLHPEVLVSSRRGRRLSFRDDATTRGIARLRMDRRRNGSWMLSFRVVGVDMLRLVTQYPLCEVLAVAIGNDEGVSGIDLDRPRGVASDRIKVRGTCPVAPCPTALVAPLARGPVVRVGRHRVCPL